MWTFRLRRIFLCVNSAAKRLSGCTVRFLQCKKIHMNFLYFYDKECYDKSQEENSGKIRHPSVKTTVFSRRAFYDILKNMMFGQTAKKRVLSLFLLLGISCLMLLTSCTKQAQPLVVSGFYFDTCVSLTLYEDTVLYHHILDPATGFPVANDLYSVTIVCKDAAAADALSTACFVPGIQKGLALIEETDGAEALFLDNEMNPHPS